MGWYKKIERVGVIICKGRLWIITLASHATNIFDKKIHKICKIKKNNKKSDLPYGPNWGVRIGHKTNTTDNDNDGMTNEKNKDKDKKDSEIFDIENKFNNDNTITQQQQGNILNTTCCGNEENNNENNNEKASLRDNMMGVNEKDSSNDDDDLQKIKRFLDVNESDIILSNDKKNENSNKHRKENMVIDEPTKDEIVINDEIQQEVWQVFTFFFFEIIFNVSLFSCFFFFYKFCALYF